MSPPGPRDAVLLLIRAVLVGLGALGGFLVAGALRDVDAINTVYIAILGGLIASLLSARPARALRAVVRQLADAAHNVPPQAVLAATVATILALLISVLLNSILSAIPGFAWYHMVAITLILAGFLGYVAVINHALLAPLAGPPASERRAAPRGPAPKLVDTSAIIDGRLLEVAQSGFLEGTLIVPAFVLRELQVLADAGDATRRSRGRRGLEVLERIRASGAAELAVREFAGAGGVDDRLVQAALETGAALLTNDHALSRIAGLQGIRVLSLNALAEALKSRHGVGDEITIAVVKEGSQPGQGVGYLDDGTMVVVEDGLALRGRTIKVAVVSNIQTALGRMIFAKPTEVV